MAKIAKVYGLNTQNPRSAAFLVTYHLKKQGIQRRDRIEELWRHTEAAVVAWVARHFKADGRESGRPAGAEPGGQGDGPVPLTEAESAVVELLRAPNLIIERFDPMTKGRARWLSKNCTFGVESR